MTKPTEIIETLEESATATEEVSADRVAGQLGRRSIGALLAIPAAFELTPIGGLPGVPTLLASIVAVVAMQILIGRRNLWLPDILARRSVGASRLAQATDRLRPAAEWADRHLGGHLPCLVAPPAPRFAAAAILALCATVPGLELVPFASSIPMGTIVLFGLALLARDGRVMALAWACTAAAFGTIWWLWP
ncbi:exopolysaccharide biosynthesis protein [Jannaschia seohaensis]|uniref:Uncharacterized conserved protein n=1 Tax=Jannaschia seohaensis TaxID=475081 RepID=A0A2Y9AG27_9RHOB|nr:exopolysaccharide biosynthesis protein [Jannaschia seohaensis]PWJ20867.1 hypothetical protein BCF38_102113 [Jannaschia seohaensis]SSA41277.1 Uncharacterized conserved protein [Jannaschia seohaensis]